MSGTVRRSSIVQGLAPKGPAGRVLSFTLAILLLCGCSSWRAKPYPDYLQNSETEVVKGVRVILKNGDELTLWNAYVEGDSLIGMSEKEPQGIAASSRVLVPKDYQGPRLVVALADIDSLRVEERDATKTVLMVLLSGVFVLGMIAFISLADWNLNSSY